MNIMLTNLLPAPAMQNLHDPSGIGYADTLDPQVPLQVRVGPYVTIAAGDIIDLFCDGQLAFNYTVKAEDLTPETPSFVVLPLDQRFIQPDEITLLYKVTEPIGGLQNESTPQPIAVKLTLPGGTDINPATPWENERLALPVVSPAGIITSPDGVSVEIAPYLNMDLGDRISLSWNGEFARTSISDLNQIGKPVVIPVSKEIIELAGDSDMLEVRYEARDRVNNWSRWSLPVFTEVEAGNTTLPAPITPQAANMELDLDNLGTSNVQVLVISNTAIKAGDEITLLVERNTAEGIALDSYSTAITVDGQVSFFEFVVPNAQFQPIAQGRARLKYRVRKQSGEVLRSKSLALKILGTTMELPSPRIPIAEQNGGVLDPASHNVVAEVPAYYFMAEGNVVNLVWMGKTASGANVMYEAPHTVSSADLGKVLTFIIPDQKVSVLAGGSVQLYYTVTTADKDFFQSPTLVLPVSAADNIDLPAPTMDTVGADGVVKPSNIPDTGATVRVSYEGMLADDQVVVHWLGASVFDSPSQSVGTSDSLAFNLPKSYITDTQGRAATLSYSMLRNGVSQDSKPLLLSVRSGMSFDTSPVALNGKIYLIPGRPDVLPAFPADTTVTRPASGGQTPYTYSSSHPEIAVVDANGFTSVRGRGTATISVTDATGETLSYEVTVAGVIHCVGVGSGKWYPMRAACGNAGGRLPTLDELREIHSAYGNSWPMGQGNYWSSTVAKNFLGAQWLYVKHLNNGNEFSLSEINATFCVAVR